MSSKQPRIACLGAGYWGKNLVRNFRDLGALAAVGEIDAERRQELAALYPDVAVLASPDEILADPEIDGIVIATPAVSHAEWVRRGLLAGKDVLVEKPLCLSPEEGEELVQLAAARGRVLMVGHLLWYHPAVLELKRLVDSGELGRLRYVYSNRLNLGKIRRQENILWSFAPHDVSVILGLLGEMPVEATAVGGNYLHDAVTDVTVSTLRFASGVRGHIFVSWLHPFKEQKLVVIGDRKMAVFDDVAPVDKLLLYPHEVTWRDGVPVASKAEAVAVPFDSVEPLRAECQHFLDCVTSRRTPRTDGAEGLRVLKVLAEFQRGLDRGQAATAPAAAAPVPAPAAERPYFVHASSYVDDGVEIGDGTRIWHFSHVLKNCRIGRGCNVGQNVVIGPGVTVGNNVKIQNNVSVYQGVTLEDDVFCGPSMVFTNVYNPRSEIRRMDELRPTLVRRGATIGANATIVCGVTLGEFAFIGAGAVVLEDVPDFALVAGNPARRIGWMCRCGHRIDFEQGAEQGSCRECSRTYLRRDGKLEAA
jgi:UDP-2-acetamido-3-amino-2,3-dideoxy-glucuronate N-acetyltransferase